MSHQQRGGLIDSRMHSGGWSDQTLDVFICVMKNVNRQRRNFSNPKDFFREVCAQMDRRGFKFKVEQVESKWRELRDLYVSKQVKEQEFEPELVALFKVVASDDTVTPLGKRRRIELRAVTEETNELSKETTQGWLFQNVWTNKAKVALLNLLDLNRSKLARPVQNKQNIWMTILEELQKQGYNFSLENVIAKAKSILKNGLDVTIDQRPTVGKELTENNSREHLLNLIEEDEPRIINLSPEFDYSDTTFNYHSFDADDFQEQNEAVKAEILNNDFTERITHPPNVFISEEVFELDCQTESAEEMDSSVVTIKGDLSTCQNASLAAVDGTPNQSPTSATFTADEFKNIAHEIATYRTERLQLEREKIELKHLQLAAYKERTSEIAKIGLGLTELLQNLIKNK